MKYLSVCSGIEAATSAWHHMGWEPVAFSEIEPFPSAVLKHHYPDVPNVGDMTKFKEWNIGTIDLLVGGTPCQSFSVAGLRKGLDDPRGNLMLTFGAIARHLSPRWLVWENVPGVLSSNGGRDFGTFLGMLGELGYGFAYRVLDAQYFGVAQRRRRVFVVGCLGDWRSAAAVLFELASLSGNPPPSREARKVTPTLSASGTGVSRVGFNCEDEWFVPQRPQWWDGGDSAASLTTRCHEQSMPDKGNFAAVAQPIDFRNLRYQDKEVSGTMQAKPTGGYSLNYMTGIQQNMAVRRLTPVECERLQGFPDNHTLIPWRGKEASQCPDGPRYKALGNSMAVPVMRWIGERIRMINELPK
jgi:DNA (cytosine-5)-methyltransferase 1